VASARHSTKTIKSSDLVKVFEEVLIPGERKKKVYGI
jgi:hypothetical protein